ncbi:hydrolase 2, exosortase A system-associated [Aquincola tertiaricarbonis]|uniref:Alpha/beta hydrolase superfamily Esterase n=1 Tax=Aquincola tertiaricarbonis TaxID=391953 RepID=A0A1S6R6S1_AQUTE|nr:hydrolase 2, exosortase A system-associated [Aquincola tertiaricarbonis]AQW45605.1 alpha/beta hydrolase superfamily Esterase [Aquincola tertiaricarbonis]URI10267.1 hydrolase 2, exosortase A system-associated [Aquincola tertiaricarbonis]
MEAFFLPVAHAEGGRFCIHHPSAAGPSARGAVLYLHPFAEEMNKSRRMVALQARALARLGYAVLCIDLHGCGDSAGDLADASWAGWVADALAGAHWLQARHPGLPLTLWGLRTGALLAGAVAAALPAPSRLLLWQPVTAGKQALQQFLRLQTAADLIDGKQQGAAAALRQQLAAGQTVEVAGYRLPAAVAQGLEAATLVPGAGVDSLLWLEVSSRAEPALTPASTLALNKWRAAGVPVQSAAVRGPAFWQTVEIEDAPALIEATTAALVAGLAAEAATGVPA